MKDRDFLIHIHARLEHVYDENPLCDFMHKLRAIISATPARQETPNDGRGEGSLEELEKKLYRRRRK